MGAIEFFQRSGSPKRINFDGYKEQEARHLISAARKHPKWDETISKYEFVIPMETVLSLATEVKESKMSNNKGIKANEKEIFASVFTDTSKGKAMHPSGVIRIGKEVVESIAGDPFKQYVVDALATVQSQNSHMQQTLDKMQQVFDLIIGDYLKQVVQDLDGITELGEKLESKGGDALSKEDVEALANRIRLAQESVAMLDNSPAVNYASEDNTKMVNEIVNRMKGWMEHYHKDIAKRIEVCAIDSITSTNKAHDSLMVGLNSLSNLFVELRDTKSEIIRHINKSTTEVRRSMPNAGRDPMR